MPWVQQVEGKVLDIQMIDYAFGFVWSNKESIITLTLFDYDPKNLATEIKETKTFEIGPEDDDNY